jgi:hypothetical protein
MEQRLNQTVIEAAIRGFQADRERIDNQIAELRAMLNGNRDDGAAQSEATAPGKRRKFSPAAIRRMREAQQRRWEKVRGESAAQKEAPKRKRRMSAEGRRAIAEATRKRWAAFRAQNATPTKGSPKKKAA